MINIDVIDNDTFYADVQRMASVLQMEMKEIREQCKSQLKNMVKERINKRMVEVVKRSMTTTKMRFVKSENTFTRKMYIQRMKGTSAIKTLKTRLNMIPIYGNVKGDVTIKRTCWHCRVEDDTTEHLISCKIFQSNILKPEHLSNDENVEVWRMINEYIDCNLRNRPSMPMFRQENTDKQRTRRKARKNPELTV